MESDRVSETRQSELAAPESVAGVVLARQRDRLVERESHSIAEVVHRSERRSVLRLVD